MPRCKKKKESHHLPIVLIDSSLKELPRGEDLHFIKGQSYEDPTLIQANIQKAKFIVITADPNVVEQEADMRTIMTLLTAKGLNPSLTAIVEILTDKQMDNARRAGADHIVKTSALTTQAFTELLNRSKG
ncbi:NAD-binding protein [Terrilactibacillus sp. S3-3]|nr:NAD-binding protein [Terrilactibacillus sp. S3-3]